MQTSSFNLHRLTPPGAPFSGRTVTRFTYTNDHHNRLCAFKKDGFGFNGKMVDENMIVLRERIRKMEAEMDGGGDDWLPNNWMEWEKRYVYSGGYHSDVYEMVALLQRFLMESRPAVGLGLVAVMAVSGSAVAVAVLWWLRLVRRQDWTGLDRTGLDWTGQESRTGQDGTGQDRTNVCFVFGMPRTGLDWQN
ncbi:hypothetical protein OSB04_018182 [Centaurea solstitialis]|uniref:Uncharacterized protein n=1 Tax=Centaurea solstitialis TaxID=347529 RepID=A0AA38WA73_9ASTR|nr:hypothetical protein OSB04_018182 [Centaurea solstitialis]